MSKRATNCVVELGRGCVIVTASGEYVSLQGSKDLYRQTDEEFVTMPIDEARQLHAALGACIEIAVGRKRDRLEFQTQESIKAAAAGSREG